MSEGPYPVETEKALKRLVETITAEARELREVQRQVDELQDRVDAANRRPTKRVLRLVHDSETEQKET